MILLALRKKEKEMKKFCTHSEISDMGQLCLIRLGSIMQGEENGPLGSELQDLYIELCTYVESVEGSLNAYAKREKAEELLSACSAALAAVVSENPLGVHDHRPPGNAFKDETPATLELKTRILGSRDDASDQEEALRLGGATLRKGSFDGGQEAELQRSISVAFEDLKHEMNQLTKSINSVLKREEEQERLLSRILRGWENGLSGSR